MGIGDLPPPPGYSQVPLLKQNPFPLSELKAGGGYDRLIYLPDDIIPTLNLGYTWENLTDVPHLLRSQADGSLRVYQAGAAVGGGWSPTGYISGSDINRLLVADGATVTVSGQLTVKPLYQIWVGAVLKALSAGATEAALDITIQDAFYSVHIGVLVGSAAGQAVNQLWVFSPPLSPSLSGITQVSYQISATGNGASWNVSSSSLAAP